jgi:hypothetical protein
LRVVPGVASAATTTTAATIAGTGSQERNGADRGDHPRGGPVRGRCHIGASS